MMVNRIGVDWVFGRPSQGAEEHEARAADAALAVLGGHSAIDCEAKYYFQLCEVLCNERGMTGLAALWVKARDAACVALTKGWAKPDGASCSIRAA